MIDKIIQECWDILKQNGVLGVLGFATLYAIWRGGDRLWEWACGPNGYINRWIESMINMQSTVSRATEEMQRQHQEAVLHLGRISDGQLALVKSQQELVSGQLELIRMNRVQADTLTSLALQHQKHFDHHVQEKD